MKKQLPIISHIAGIIIGHLYSKYKENSHIYLKKSWEFYEKKDFAMASETGWGAVALALKACAKKRNLYHKSHESLRHMLYTLSKEKNDPEMRELFAESEQLHVNFYELLLKEEQVEEYLQAATKLTKKIHNHI